MPNTLPSARTKVIQMSPLSLQNSHILPPLPQQAYSHRCRRLAPDILNFQQLVFPPESQEMRKERVEVGLGAEVEDVLVVRVVYVCEDAKELAVDVFDCGREGGVEVLPCGSLSSGAPVMQNTAIRT